MITLDEYYKGRDVTFVNDLTREVRDNARETVRRANDLLSAFGEYRTVNSGWRPAALNALTPHAAPNSKHVTGEAIDISDDDGTLDSWLMTPAGEDALRRVQLWHEHPDATPRWAHVQIRPPVSGNLHFYP